MACLVQLLVQLLTFQCMNLGIALAVFVLLV